MKRDAYDDDGPAMKRPRNPDDEVTFLIPSKVAGSIIGKGGANITNLRKQVRWVSSACDWRLQRVLVAGPAPPPPPPRPAPPPQYKASISVPDCPGPERVLSVAAHDVEIVLEILKEILPNLADQGGPKGGGNLEELDVRLLIHQSRAGCVIGKGGAKIKELRDKTGARLKIFSNPAPQSTERVVQLFGNPEAVVAGVREVLDLTRQVPIKGPVGAYDPHNYDDFYSEEYGGYGGQGGEQGRRGGGGGGGSGPRGGGARRGGPGMPPRGPPPNMARNGPPGDRSGPRGYNDYGGGPHGKFDGPPPGGYGYGGRAPPMHPAYDAPDEPETSTQVTIPKDLAGAIIGKSGMRIRKIRAESGAGIEIAEPLPGAEDRIITITGTPPRIQMAQYLLQQSVHESNPNIGRGHY